MAASVVQIVGLLAVVAGAVVAFGAGGGIAAGGAVAVFVGLAMERDR